MPPGMGMAGGGGGRPQWQPNTSTPMNYSSSSPGNYGVSCGEGFRRSKENLSSLRFPQGPPGSGPPGPGTPIMPSPQGKHTISGQKFAAITKMPFRFIADSSNSGGDNMYTLMKPVTSGSMGRLRHDSRLWRIYVTHIKSNSHPFGDDVRIRIDSRFLCVLGISNECRW